MKLHLSWFVPIALFALAGPRVLGADDGPSLFLIPQRQSPTTQASIKAKSPAQARDKKASPAPPRVEKIAPAQTGAEKKMSDVKTPYSGKRVVNRPVTMPVPVPNKPDRSDNRILSGAGQGTIGRYQARIELRRDGTFVVTGNIQGSGTWKQIGQTIVMESQTSHYEGKLENSAISGTRTFKGRDGIEPWRFVLSDRTLEIKLEFQGKPYERD